MAAIATVDGWTERVDRVIDTSAELEMASFLLRPDGHVAWIGDDQQELFDVFARWFGNPGH